MPIVIILFVICGLYLGSLTGAGHWAIISTAVFGFIGLKVQQSVNAHYEKMSEEEINDQLETIQHYGIIAAVIIGVLYAASHITW